MKAGGFGLPELLILSIIAFIIFIAWLILRFIWRLITKAPSQATTEPHQEENHGMERND